MFHVSSVYVYISCVSNHPVTHHGSQSAGVLNMVFHLRRNRVLLLNTTTDIINFWQDEETETKNTVELAKEKFPGVVFQGA